MPHIHRFPIASQPVTVHGTQVQRNFLHNVMISYFDQHGVRDRYLHMFWGDRRYFVMTRPSIDALLDRCSVLQPYVPERFDCEDFARIFVADAVRMVHYEAQAGLAIAKGSFTHDGGAHALNIIFEWQRQPQEKIVVHFFEPIRHKLMTMADLQADYQNVSFYHVSF